MNVCTIFPPLNLHYLSPLSLYQAMPLPFPSMSLKNPTNKTTYFLVANSSLHTQTSAKQIRASNESISGFSASRLFDEMPQRNVSFYAAKISSFCESQHWDQVLITFLSMLLDGFAPDKFLVPKPLKACTKLNNLHFGASLHGYIISSNIEIDIILGNSLIDMYAKCGDFISAHAIFNQMKIKDVISYTSLVNSYLDTGLLDEAYRVFNSMQFDGIEPDFISWNALISGFAQNGDISTSMNLLEEMKNNGLNPGVNSFNGIISGCVQSELLDLALNIFREMHLSLKPNEITISSVLLACAGLKALNFGKELHAYVIRNHIKFNSNVFVSGSLINMYTKCREFLYAERVFSKINNKNVTLWNEIISAYVENDEMIEAFNCFKLMRKDGFKPDLVTYNILIGAYAQKGQKEEAFNVFHLINQAGLSPNIVSINMLLSGFYQSGLYVEALDFFRTFMQNGQINPNGATITSILLVLTELKLAKLGKEIHGYISKKGLKSNIFVLSNLVDLYAKCGKMGSARRVFDEMPDKNTVIWNILLSGCNYNKDPEVALKVFVEMLERNFMPNSVTLMTLLFTCALAMDLKLGKELHGYIKKIKHDSYQIGLSNALIDMYSKCGSIEEAKLVFDTASEKDIILYNTMIASYALYNMANDAINLFEELIQFELIPDKITFLSLLKACKQEGFIDQAWKYYNKMEGIFGISPSLEHLTCMIDIMGSAGLLNESLDIITKMPFQPDACLWATLLKSCSIHSNYEIGEKAARVLFEIEPINISNYFLLHNIYAKNGMWDQAQNLEKNMKSRGLILETQRSWLYIDRMVHAFNAGDGSHDQMESILETWNYFADEMRRKGYNCQNIIFEARIDPFICYHTERLAVCLGLISENRYGPVRVVKNIRMCVDCHFSINFISKIEKREILVFDGCLYHRFKDGKCSCGDNW